MTIRTVTVSGVTTVNFDPENKNPYFFASEKYAWIKNNSDAAMYVSLDSSCTMGAAGTAMISSGEAGRIELSPANILYISGSGSAEIRTGDNAVCPFKSAGRGGDTFVRVLGVTTTPLTDGATTSPIIIDGAEHVAEPGDLVAYGSKEFLFNTNGVWDESGDVTNVYTKSETDNLLSAKANAVDVYTKTQTDSTFITKSDIDIKTAPTTAEINASIAHIWGVI